MDDINNFESWAQGSICYVLLKAVANMNDFELWAQGSRCYEQY